MSSYTFEELVELDALGDDVLGPSMYPPGAAGFVFGGQLAAQAVRAALTTVPEDRHPQSLHAHFLTAADPDRDLTYRVHRVRDGGSLSTRQVDAEQEGGRVFTSTVSFHRTKHSLGAVEYQLPRPAAPDPADPTHCWADYLRDTPYFSCFDLRELGPAEPRHDGRREYSRRLWFRVRDRLPDDPGLHSVALAFASDLGVTIAASVTAGLNRRATVLSSLDHTLWWHRPARADQWMLLDLVSVSNSRWRGLVRGSIHTQDGVLVASLAQETLIR